MMPHDFWKLSENVDASSAMAMLASSADVLLVLSSDGRILNATAGGENPTSEFIRGWTGKKWADVSTVESKPKIEQMLSDAVGQNQIKWRQINHPTPHADVAVKYLAMRAGPKGEVVAVGRDLRAIADLQQRLVTAEQAVEAEFARLRSTETRYRVLFQSIQEAVLVADAKTGVVLEANEAAATVLDQSIKRLVGGKLQDCLGPVNHGLVADLMKLLSAKGQVDDTLIRITNKDQVLLALQLFRQDRQAYVMARLQTVSTSGQSVVVPRSRSHALSILDEMPDGFVVTDKARVVLFANKAFLELAQVGSEAQVKGQTLDRWLGRASADVASLANRLAERGALRSYETVMRGSLGVFEDVEVSAVSVAEDAAVNMGFVIRPVARRAGTTTKEMRLLEKSAEQMTALVGKVPLKDLVRETTDIVERLCIEAALQLNGNNRASTAEMLGLSRQSLYNRLERFGIGDSAE
jgi:transcriptional regulator PpsR